MGRPSVRVLLVNMPWSSLRPSLGLGLLKAGLARRGIGVEVFNANIRLARRIGPSFYHYVSDVAPVEGLFGEWAFCDAAFPGHTADGYLDLARSRFGDAFPADAETKLRAARQQSEAFLQECEAVVLKADAEVVGFTSSFAQNLASLALAKRIKAARPATTIALGGANCEDEMGLELHRAFPFIDLVFSGEADLSLPDVLDRLQRGLSIADVPGVIARGKDGDSVFASLVPDRVRDLDLLPYPDYDDFFAEYKVLPRGSRMAGLPLESSRGCWWGEKHHCTFCGLNGLAMTFRTKSPERVVAEVDDLTLRYGVRDVQFVDNILDMRFFHTVLPQFAAKPRPPALFYETKANLKREHLEQLRAAGVRAIQPGIESLDSAILRSMRKGTTGVRSVELLRDCRELGLWPHWNILFGFPDEDPEAYDRMADLVPAISHLDPPNVCTRLRLDRFSPLYASAAEVGLVKVEPALAYQHLYQLPADTVRGLAYYFDHEYADGRDPAAYTARLREAVDEWQCRGRAGDLLLTDDGERLTLTDSRFGRTVVTVLTGRERRLYRSCRSSQTLESLMSSEFASNSSTESILSGWVAERLIVHLHHRYLAIAIDVGAMVRSKARRKPTWKAVRDRSLKKHSPRMFAAVSDPGP